MWFFKKKLLVVIKFYLFIYNIKINIYNIYQFDHQSDSY